MRGRMLNTIQSLCASVKTCCRSGTTRTDYCTCFQGHKQGCLAFPILFSLSINQLAHDIISAGVNGISLSPSELDLFILLIADELACL